jgi:hypothetical protein
LARILAVVPDLLLASRVEGSLRGAGHEVEVVGSLPEEADGVDALVCDLDVIDPSAAVQRGVPIVGFYSHVEIETRRRAENAGVGVVVPRSRMARDLPRLVEQLLSID